MFPNLPQTQIRRPRQLPTPSFAQNVHLYYGNAEALEDITIDFPKYDVTALIGPSGCGKSTLFPA